MENSQEYYKELLSGYILNTIEPDQVKELYLFIEEQPEIYEQLMNDPELKEITEQAADHSTVELQSAADQRIREHLQTFAESSVQDGATPAHAGKVTRLSERRRRWRWIAAATILITGSVAVLVSRQKSTTPEQPQQQIVSRSDVKAPTTNKATITLANGRQVTLDSLNKGMLAQQGNVKLIKLADGQIAYQAAAGIQSEALQYNTLSNPRGSKVIDMALSDGSHVWLNAGSSLTYPVAFMSKERKVSITGEAYFEIARDASKPFYVNKGSATVKVLGTHFNVDAYDDDENIKVTLIQGSVKVLNTAGTNPAAGSSADNGSAEGIILTPGQQAAITKDNPIRIVPNPDLEAVMAWKDGLFNFNKVSLQDVMRQLSRWYDVDVQYQGAVTTKMLGGEMQRDLNLSEVLDGLKDIGVHFRLEGKKLTVMP
jgi:ferric-dicitrate binding protein FerR (iron transport regulator)